MDALAQLLTREQVLVELLVFKLVEMRQLLLAGETRFLAWAGEEVERAAATVREAELERALLVSALGEERGLVEPSLAELVADAPEPWRSLLEDTATELRAGATEVADLLAVTRRLADAGARSIAESLGSLATSSNPSYAAAAFDSAPVSRVQHVL
jgi:hypothetical protein